MWAGYIVRIKQGRSAFKIVIGKLTGDKHILGIDERKMLEGS